LDSPAKKTPGNSLAGYAIGVLFAVLMFLFVTQCLENWNLYWLARAGELENPKAFERKAGWWWSANIFAAFVTVGAFCGASIWLARVLARMPVGIPSCGIG
jgi:CDP-diglyceride synthetase